MRLRHDAHGGRTRANRLLVERSKGDMHYGSSGSVHRECCRRSARGSTRVFEELAQEGLDWRKVDTRQIR